MYPLLIDFGKQYDDAKEDVLSFIIKNIDNSVVKNGKFSGQNIKDALREFGKTAFGENGIETVYFRSCAEKENLIEIIAQKSFDVKNPDDMIIYPFGVANNLISQKEIIADSLSLNGKTGICEEKSFIIVFVKENDCLVTDFDSTMKVNKNFAVFVPAKTRVQINGKAEIILIHM